MNKISYRDVPNVKIASAGLADVISDVMNMSGPQRVEIIMNAMKGKGEEFLKSIIQNIANFFKSSKPRQAAMYEGFNKKQDSRDSSIASKLKTALNSGDKTDWGLLLAIFIYLMLNYPELLSNYRHVEELPLTIAVIKSFLTSSLHGFIIWATAQFVKSKFEKTK